MTAQRVRYHDNQLLSAEMLTDEQTYLAGRHASHAFNEHGPGVVSGLDLQIDDAGAAVVRPGMAIGWDGRDLILPAVAVVATVADADMLDVFLSGAGDGAAATLSVRPLAKDTASDDSEDTGIFLGRLVREDGRWRRSAKAAVRSGITGQSLRGQSGPATLTFDRPELPTSPHVSLNIQDRSVLSLSESAASVDGNMQCRETATCRGPLVIPVPKTPVPAAKSAQPWRIAPGPPSADDPNVSPLQIEIPANGRLAIGVRRTDGTFAPVLSVDSDGNMDVRGTLHAAGRLTEGPMPADANEPRFVAALSEAWEQGAAMAGLDGARAPLQISYEDLSLDTVTGAITGSVVLKNSGEEAVSEVAAVLSVVGPGLYEQQLLKFRRMGLMKRPTGTISAGSEKKIDVTAIVPPAGLAPGTKLQLVTVSTFRPSKDADSQRVTAVASLAVPPVSHVGGSTS